MIIVMNGFNFLKFLTNYTMISTGINKLDNLLGGGIRGGIITDIFGATGTGKTHLTMQISINSLIGGGQVLYLDTTGQFRPERMLELIKIRNLDPNLLDRVKVARITNSSEQIKFLSKIKENGFSLIVIDNVTDLFSFEYKKEDQNLEKNVTFMQYMHELSLISIEKKIPIIVTNIIRKIDDLEKENLDKAISIFTHLKIKLTKKGTKNSCEIFPSFLKKKEFLYQISKEGLIESS